MCQLCGSMQIESPSKYRDHAPDDGPTALLLINKMTRHTHVNAQHRASMLILYANRNVYMWNVYMLQLSSL